MAAIEVLKPGLLSNFQDLGREGFQHLGVPVSGVMDELSHRLANWAVGNPPGTATLEITLQGPVLRFNVACTLAWCGADLSPTLDGQPLERATATRVPAGSELRFGKRRSGARAYLALRGGFALDEIMGSCSTNLRGAFGGQQGRALRQGDGLAVHNPLYLKRSPRMDLSSAAAAALDALLAADHSPLRTLPGPDWLHFTPAAQAAWVEAEWTMSPRSDRMGYCLQGPLLERQAAQDLLSCAVAFGSVQVPPDGQPIVLMADRPTTGGYPRIAELATVERCRLAQALPGATLRFTMITLEQSQALLRERERLLALLTEKA